MSEETRVVIAPDATAEASDGFTAPSHDAAGKRFVIHTVPGGEEAALVEYSEAGAAHGKRAGSVLDFHHTFSGPEHRGKGLAGRVVEAALAHCRANGVHAVASCSYVRRFADKHPEWSDVVLPPAVRAVAADAEAAAVAEGAPSTASAGATPEPSPGDHGAHIFGLAYEQYATRVYAPGQHATESTPALGRLRADADPVLASRLASLCARRAAELEAEEGPGAGLRSPDSLRLEAAHVLTVLAEAEPGMEWVGGSTGAVVDDLETRGFLLGFRDRPVRARPAGTDAATAKRARPAEA